MRNFSRPIPQCLLAAIVGLGLIACAHKPEIVPDAAEPLKALPDATVQDEITRAIYAAMGTEDIHFDMEDLTETGLLIVSPKPGRYTDSLPRFSVTFIGVQGPQNCYLEDPNGQAIADWNC